MESLAANLVQWLKTFNIETSHSAVEDLSDGVVISRALNNISPEFFDQSWLAKIKMDTGSNWRLRVSNLKKILKAIVDYYSEVLGQPIIGFKLPNVSAIGEKNDPVELGRLLQLVLGCAVNCDRKQEYIEAIMGLEEAVQHVVMNAIQELMTEIPSPYPSENSEIYSELNEQLKGLTEDLHSANESKEQITQRCHELDMQVAVLLEEKANLVSENEKLLERLNHVESFEDPSTLAGKRFQQMQQKLDMLQDELYKLEMGRDELKAKVENQQKEIHDLQQKNEELQKMAEESQTMKDELDVLRHTSDKVSMYEATIETYKKKLEDLSDLRRQVKILEEKSTQYMQKNMELEEELKKTVMLKSQLDMYKKQAQELHVKLSDETKRADKNEFESRRIHEKLTSLQQEKERLIIERDSLKESLEEMRCMQQQASSHEGHGTEGSIGDSDLLDAVPPEIREKLIRLQHENKMLKLNETSNVDKQLTLLQSMLDDARSRENELETDNRLANKRILELESQLEDLQANQTAVSAQEDSELRQKLHLALRKQKETEAELQQKRVIIESLESQVEVSVHKNHQLQELLCKKSEEMKEMEERYRKYLKKARNVIKNLNPSKNTGPGVDFTAFRTMILEKEKKISSLEKETERMRTLQDMEDKLMTTAFYNLAVHLQKKMADERLNQIDAGQTFLSRQRQTTSRRLTTPGVISSDFFEC